MYQILVIFVLKWDERSSQHRERLAGERFTSVPQISGGEAQKTIVSYSSLRQHTCQSKQPHLTHYMKKKKSIYHLYCGKKERIKHLHE